MTDITETVENTDDDDVADLTEPNFDGRPVGKQVMIVAAPNSEVNVAAPNSEDNDVDISKEGKQFLIVAGQDSSMYLISMSTVTKDYKTFFILNSTEHEIYPANPIVI